MAEEEDKTKDVAKDVQVAGEPPVATNTDQQLDFSLTLRKKRAQPKQSLKRLIVLVSMASAQKRTNGPLAEGS